jgi:hypothetical protein
VNSDLASDVIGLTLLLLAGALIWRALRAARRLLARHRPEDVLTNVVACLITAIAAQGMFRFFGDRLEMPWWMQSLTFCVFELAQVACALRARRKTRETGRAGFDGVLVWVMSGISAVLSATDAHGWAALARMLFPFAAAILWERGLAIERKRSGRTGINWRITPERILVRLGIAESAERTASDVDAHRRLTRVAVATQRLTAAPEDSWRAWLAGRRQAAAVRRAVEYADLATDPDRQAALLAQIGALRNAQVLAQVCPPAPWAIPPARPTLRVVRLEEFERIQARRARTRVPDDVLPPVPAELEPLVKKGRRKFRNEIEAGKVPSIGRLKDALRIGQDRATAIQPYLAVPGGREGA